jgi:hypothetical protein
MIDQLLPEVTTGALAALLARDEDERPVEGLLWEFKKDESKRNIAKTVCAFANTRGGILILGAEEQRGRLSGFPGVAADREWSATVANIIRDTISPWPAWFPTEVASPSDPLRRVLVVKVPRSTRTPHVYLDAGVVYVRSPGGKNDPIGDQTTLARLMEQGRSEDEAANTRLAEVARAIPAPPSPSMTVVRWTLGVIATPLPYGAYPQRGLLTEAGFNTAATWFSGSPSLAHVQVAGMLENGLRLQVPYENEPLTVVVYDDGTMSLRWGHHSDTAEHVSLGTVRDLVRDVLVAQRRQARSIAEARVMLIWRSGGVSLVDRRTWFDEKVHAAPCDWSWKTDAVLLSDDAPDKYADDLMRRLWRAAGGITYDPE